nr:unnamed protein product [Callosobruchus analis]
MYPRRKSPDDESNKNPSQTGPTHRTGGGVLGAVVGGVKRSTSVTRGVATSFGFRRGGGGGGGSAAAARRLATAHRQDGNGNEDETEPLAAGALQPGRTTPRLAPPKKDALGAKGARFGFRQTQSNRQNKVADLNTPLELVNQNCNNNMLKRAAVPIGSTAVMPTDNNRNNRVMKPPTQAQIGRYTFQSTQLPRPEPVRLIETKSAKTLANNNKRAAGMYQHHQQQYSPEDCASKDGSLTEDSGVGSHISTGYSGDNDPLTGLEQLESSPNFGARRRNSQKCRNLEIIVTPKKTFDVKDMDDSNDSCDSIPPPPLPQLPSAFNVPDNKKRSYQTGLVRERTMEYQRHLEWDNHNGSARKISVTSSEGFSDDYGDEEKTFRDTFRSEKTFFKSATTHKAFLKSRTDNKGDSSPPSSDEPDWTHGGEAMADETSFSFSSSDESRDRNREECRTEPEPAPISAVLIGTALHSLMTCSATSSSGGSMTRSYTNTAAAAAAITANLEDDRLVFEDPKFAAVAAAASNTESLLDDETLMSPTDSILSCTESEEIKKKAERSSSNSKDINEKASPSSPGTPTNASNSLSLSDGKDDFLIDDEIADQPALVFEDNVTPAQPEPFTCSTSQNTSDTTVVMESTPKPKRRPVAFEGSPLSLKTRRGLLRSRAGSLDTLSPCESIASDDLMMDYDVSQSSGLEDCDRIDRNSSCISALNETLVGNSSKGEHSKVRKDWNRSVESIVNRDSFKSNSGSQTSMVSSVGGGCSSVTMGCAAAPRARLLRSRASTPLTPLSAPDSPARRRAALATAVGGATAGYDSDGGGDSLRLDRAAHAAVKQDILGVKAMLVKLKRVLNESETHNPLDSQTILTNGIFSSPYPTTASNCDSLQESEDSATKAKFELAELRKQVLFLQGQIEDRETTIQSLQEQMVKLANENYHANSAPASVTADCQMCNAATQTERCE